MHPIIVLHFIKFCLKENLTFHTKQIDSFEISNKTLCKLSFLFYLVQLFFCYFDYTCLVFVPAKTLFLTLFQWKSENKVCTICLEVVLPFLFYDLVLALMHVLFTDCGCILLYLTRSILYTIRCVGFLNILPRISFYTNTMLIKKN